MTATKPQPDAPISQAVAAQQTDWHVRQSAGYFIESNRTMRAPQGRQLSRKRFINDARHALPSLGLDAFLAAFQRHLLDRSYGTYFEQAEPIIRELWAELQIKSVGGSQSPAAVPQGDAVQVALSNAQRLLAVGLQQIDTALRLVNRPTAAGVETRGQK